MTPPRTPPHPSRPNPSRSAGAGGTVLLAVACSVLASAATCFLIIRFSLVSPPEKTAPRTAAFQPSPAVETRTTPPPNRTATRGASPVAADELVTTEPPDLFGPQTPAPVLQRQVAAAAPAVLDLITTVRNPDYGFIVGGKHSQLGRELQTIETLANRITQNPGLTADETTQLLGQYSAALTAAINRADNIAGRETEDPTSVEISRTLKARLEQARDALPQP